jgi:hypothetical protein
VKLGAMQPKLKRTLLICLVALWAIPLVVFAVLYLGLRFDGGHGPQCPSGETRPFHVADVQRVLRSSGIATTLDPHNQGCAVPGVQMVVVSGRTTVPLVQCNVSAKSTFSRTKMTEYNTRPRRTFGLANVECDLVPLGSDRQVANQLARVRTAVAALENS